MSDPLTESHSAEAVNAAAVHAEAIEKARAAQMSDSEARISELVGVQIKEAIEHAFFVPTEPGKQKKFIDITQIPRICDDISDIKNTLWWLNKIATIIGAGGLAVFAALVSRGNFHL